MSYFYQRLQLASRIQKRRAILEKVSGFKSNYLNLISALYTSQGRFIAWTLANYLIVVLELLALQYFLSIYVFATSLQILRFVSFLSILPLFLLLAIGNLKKIESSALSVKQQAALNAKDISIAGCKLLFGIKSICALIVVVIAVNSGTFSNKVPEVVQALVLARLLAAPWESATGFLMMRKIGTFKVRRFLISRQFAILTDLLGIAILVSSNPVTYFIFHLGIRILRAKFVFKFIAEEPLSKLYFSTKREMSHVVIICKYFLKNIGLPFAIAVVSEYIFFISTKQIVRESPLFAQFVFLVHTQYHVAIVIALRFLRRRISDFGDERYFLNLKSRLLEYRAWRRVCLLSVLVSAPVALLSIVPFLFLEIFSPSGEAVSISKELLFWPLVVSFSHVLCVLLAAANIKLDFKKQLWFFALICFGLFVSTQINTFLLNLSLSEDDLLSFAFLSDSLLQLLMAIIGAAVIVRLRGQRELPLLDRVIESDGTILAQILEITWKKGVVKKLIISKIVFQDYKVQELRLGKRHSCYLLLDSESFDADSVISKLAPFIEKARYQKAVNHEYLLSLLVANKSDQDLKQFDTNTAAIEYAQGGFDLSKVSSPDDIRKYKNYFNWASINGVYSPIFGSFLHNDLKVHINAKKQLYVEVKKKQSENSLDSNYSNNLSAGLRK